MTRHKEILHSCFHNSGKTLILKHERYVPDRTREFFLFNVVPMGKPRMTQRDKFYKNPDHPDKKKRQRPVVAQYWAYRDTLLWQANKMGYTMGEFIDGVYFSPMPDSWSEKKKDRENGMPCQVKPDTDNITKGLKDIFNKSDSKIWLDVAQHRWATFGSILLYG